MPVTKIEWTSSAAADGGVLPGYSFNPWLGCTKVSPACDHCYAEGWAKRTGQPRLWTGERRLTSETNWRQPVKWNRQAEASGVRRRVFCASLADAFDNQVPDAWRSYLWGLIARTPHLDWLLLTKRPQCIRKMLPDPATGAPPWGIGWPNVWIGTTAENQEEADRCIPHLLAVPAVVRFLSCEPLLGEIDLMGDYEGPLCGGHPTREQVDGPLGLHYLRHGAPRIDWVICGGESGPDARTMRPAWAASLRDQCASAGVPFFMKQMTKKAPIPAELMVREWPDADVP